MATKIVSPMKVMEMSAGARNLYQNLMDAIMKSGRVREFDVVAVEAWGRMVQECLCRLGQEFHKSFIAELKRQALRLGGRTEVIDDVIVVQTIAKLVEEIDPLLQFKTHPTLKMLNRNRTNLLAPMGRVLYRMRRMVVRRNRHGTVTTQLTMRLNTTDHETMLDRLDDAMDEEELYVG